MRYASVGGCPWLGSGGLVVGCASCQGSFCQFGGRLCAYSRRSGGWPVLPDWGHPAYAYGVLTLVVLSH